MNNELIKKLNFCYNPYYDGSQEKGTFKTIDIDIFCARKLTFVLIIIQHYFFLESQTFNNGTYV